MATAMVSALTGIPVRKDVAMTGEITLRGRVLPIGGLKRRSSPRTSRAPGWSILPRKNEKDLRDIPEEIRKQIARARGHHGGRARGGTAAQAAAAGDAQTAPTRDAEPATEPAGEAPMRRPNSPPDQPTVVV